MTDAAFKSLVLVTGAGGLIGSAVVRNCMANGIAVRAHMGPPGVAVLDAPPGIGSAFARIDDKEALVPLFRDVDAVVHLAGPPSVARSFDAPAEYIRAHALGTATVLEACRTTGVSRLVYVSSAEVYGQPQFNPVSEEHPRRPRSPYAVAKVLAEDLVVTCARSSAIAASVLRPFSVIGPTVSSNSVLGSIIRQAVTQDEVAVFAPQIVRDYIYVDDVASAILRCLATEASPGSVAVWNIGSGVGTSVVALAELVLQRFGKTPRVRRADEEDRPARADIERLVANIDKAAAELGWRPRTSLSDALAAIIAAQTITESFKCAS